MELKNTIDLNAAPHSHPSLAASARFSKLWKSGVVLAAFAVPLALQGCGNNGATAGSGGTTVASPDSELAKVGDTTINRQQMYSLLEANLGDQALTQLIDGELVKQAMKTANVEVTDEELQAAIDERQKTNPAIARYVKNGGVQLENLRNTLRNQLGVEKLLLKDVKDDPKAVAAWLAKNRKEFDQPARVKLGILFASTKKRADVLASQLKGGKTFLQLVEEQKKTIDPIAKNSTNDTSAPVAGASPPDFIPVNQLPTDLGTAVNKLKTNETSGVVTLKGAQNAFAIIRLIDRQEAVAAKATDAKVISEWKLEQAARKTTKELQPSVPFEQVLQQAQQSLMQQAMQSGRMEAPGRREAISAINQGATQKVLNDLRSKANVTISDPMYATVAEAYKAAATPPLGANAPAGGASTGGAPSGAAPSTGAPSGAAPSGAAPSGSIPETAPPSADAPAAGAPSSSAPATKSGG